MRPILPLVMLALPGLAQVPAAAAPGLLRPEHRALREFAGTWDVTGEAKGDSKHPATGSERAEILCDGLWLKRTLHLDLAGRAFDAVSLTGWDPGTKTYVSLRVESGTPHAKRSVAAYDAKTRTWSSRAVGTTKAERSVLAWNDGDSAVETFYVTEPAGTEAVVLELVRRRRPSVAGSLANASTKPTTTTTTTDATTNANGGAHGGAHGGADRPDDDPGLRAYVGTWDTVTTTQPEGDEGKAHRGSGVEINDLVGDGRWLWSDATGVRAGAAYERHGLLGFDPRTGRFSSFWVDSATPYLTELSGACNATTRTIVYTGGSRRANGVGIEVASTETWSDDDRRHTTIRWGGEDAVNSIRIDATRRRPGAATPKPPGRVK